MAIISLDSKNALVAACCCLDVGFPGETLIISFAFFLAALAIICTDSTVTTPSFTEAITLAIGKLDFVSITKSRIISPVEAAIAAFTWSIGVLKIGLSSTLLILAAGAVVFCCATALEKDTEVGLGPTLDSISNSKVALSSGDI